MDGAASSAGTVDLLSLGVRTLQVRRSGQGIDQGPLGSAPRAGHGWRVVNVDSLTVEVCGAGLDCAHTLVDILTMSAILPPHTRRERGCMASSGAARSCRKKQDEAK